VIFDTLFNDFPTLAESHNSIPKLRHLILQLAVQGKLVPQDTSDVPASVLLEKIKEEKEQLVTHGKIKKQKPLPPLEAGEVPYKLPEDWEWARLRNVSYDLGQKKPDVRFTYIDVASIDNMKGIISDATQTIDPSDAPSRARKIVNLGTVIYSTVRPYLQNIAIVDQEFNPEPIASTAFFVLHPFVGINSHFLYLYLLSQPHNDYVNEAMKGVAYPAVNDGAMTIAPFPLPPLAEQHRIVAKVDEMMAKCDELERELEARNSARISLNGASLHELTTGTSNGTAATRIFDNFEELYSTPENVRELRKSILQLAVQGKLVPQDLNDEPASVLLEKIAVEKERLIANGKLKNPKPLPPIDPDEVPYELPEGWEWTRAEALFLKMGAGSTPLGGKQVYQDSGIMFLRSQNVYNDGLRLDPAAFIPEIIHLKMSGTRVFPMDILLNITGGSIARAALVPDEFDEANVSQHVAILRPFEREMRRYIHLWLVSPFGYRNIMGVQVGISREGLSMTSLRKFIIPIPPPC